MVTSIKPGDVFEFIDAPELKIYIMSEATERATPSWGVHDRYVDWQCILEDDYIREKFRYVYTESVEEQTRLQKLLNPTHDDLRERAKEGTAWA
jgi:hypothetical protein